MAIQIPTPKRGGAYENPETVVVSQAAPYTDAINSFANAFVTASEGLVKIRNEKLKKTLAEQAKLAKDVYIDPTKFLERFEKAGATEQEYDIVNKLFDENAQLQIDIEAGSYTKEDYKDLMAQKNKTLTKLNQMVGFAGESTAFKAKWAEDFREQARTMSNQGHASAVGNEDYIAAANIFSGVTTVDKPGNVEIFFKEGSDTQMVRITGGDLTEAYEVPLASFLSNQLPTVPKYDDEIIESLKNNNILDNNGRLTKYAKNMTERQYFAAVNNLVATKIEGFSENISQANSLGLEVFGLKDPFTLSMQDGVPGTELSPEDQKKLTAAGEAYTLTIIPKHVYEPEGPSAKELARRNKAAREKANQDAFKELIDEKLTTIGLTTTPTGQFTGTVNPLSKDGEINAAFERGLSGLGYQVEERIPGKDEDEYIGIRIKPQAGTAGNGIDVLNNQIASVFIYNLMLAEGYSVRDAKDFAYRSIPTLGPQEGDLEDGKRWDDKLKKWVEVKPGDESVTDEGQKYNQYARK
tara:strand:- start:4580 stop:6148 length:1569 start_codon:yes stop_codon:yes gene_type:complete